MTVLPLSRSSPFWGMGAGGPEFASPRLNCGAPWTTGSHSRKIQPGGGKGLPTFCQVFFASRHSTARQGAA